jgi:hypothetical protein
VKASNLLILVESTRYGAFAFIYTVRCAQKLNITYIESKRVKFEIPLLRCECVDDKAGVFLRQRARRDGDSGSW